MSRQQKKKPSHQSVQTIQVSKSKYLPFVRILLLLGLSIVTILGVKWISGQLKDTPAVKETIKKQVISRDTNTENEDDEIALIIQLIVLFFWYLVDISIIMYARPLIGFLWSWVLSIGSLYASARIIIDKEDVSKPTYTIAVVILILVALIQIRFYFFSYGFGVRPFLSWVAWGGNGKTHIDVDFFGQTHFTPTDLDFSNILSFAGDYDPTKMTPKSDLEHYRSIESLYDVYLSQIEQIEKGKQIIDEMVKDGKGGELYFVTEVLPKLGYMNHPEINENKLKLKLNLKDDGSMSFKFDDKQELVKNLNPAEKILIIWGALPFIEKYAESKGIKVKAYDYAQVRHLKQNIKYFLHNIGAKKLGINEREDFLYNTREKMALDTLRNLANTSKPGDRFILQFGSDHEFEKYTGKNMMNIVKRVGFNY